MKAKMKWFVNELCSDNGMLIAIVVGSLFGMWTTLGFEGLSLITGLDFDYEAILLGSLIYGNFMAVKNRKLFAGFWAKPIGKSKSKEES